MKLNLTRPLIVFDLETTGLDLVNDRIIQISYIKIYPDGKEERENLFVYPEKPIPDEVSELTGITTDLVEDAPTFGELAPRLNEVFKGCDFAGFNSNHFDIPMLAEEFLRAEIDFDFSSVRLIDAQTIFHKMEKRNLAAAYKFYCGRKMEDDFVTGALKLGHTEEKAKEVFAIMEKFAGYGFNRSHAYAYAALAFQMAYFKVHYPDVFFDIMLNYSSSDYLTDALQSDFQLAPLSINTIPYKDKFHYRKIFLGMKNIKGLPRDLAYWIIDNRPFESVEDFILRLPKQYHKLPLLTPLAELGLFDIFEKNRRKVLQNLPNLFVFADELGSLFADSNYSWIETEDFSQAEKYEKEEAIIGVGLSTHPLVAIGKTSPFEIQPIAQLVQGEQARILIEVHSIRTIRTKSGEPMAFLQVSDTKNKLDVTLFPETYNRFSSLIKEGGYYYLTGKVQERDGRLQMILAEAQLATNEKFWLQLFDHGQDKTILSILKKYPGPYPVVLRYEDEKKTLQLKGYTVQKNQELEDELKNLVMKTIYR